MKRILLFCAVFVMALSACDREDTEGFASPDIRVVLAPSAEPVEISGITVTVTGEDMEEIVKELDIEGKIGTGSVVVPVGKDVNIKAEAYSGGQLVYAGDEDVYIGGIGQPIAVTIQLKSLDSGGKQPPEPVVPPGGDIITGKDDAPMVLIPAGEFEMGDHHGVGDGDERPVHTVYLDAFCMDECEVTNGRYARFLNEYGKNVDAAGHELLDIADGDCLITKNGNTYTPKSGYEDHPAIDVVEAMTKAFVAGDADKDTSFLIWYKGCYSCRIIASDNPLFEYTPMESANEGIYRFIPSGKLLA